MVLLMLSEVRCLLNQLGCFRLLVLLVQLSLLVQLPLLTACGSVASKDDALSSDTLNEQQQMLHSVQAEKVLVLPVFSVAKVFRSGSKATLTQLLKNLSSQGYKPFVLSEAQYEKVRALALQESGSIYKPQIGDFVPMKESVYVDTIIANLKGLVDFDLLIFPTLIVREAVLEERIAHWDGGEEELFIKYQEHSKLSLPPKVRGLSLQLKVYDAIGSPLFIRHGAITLPYYWDNNLRPARFKLRRNMFESEDIKSAVRRTLTPFSQ